MRHLQTHRTHKTQGNYVNEKEVKRCLTKARESIFEIFSEIEEELEDATEIDLRLLELTILEAMYNAFGEDFHDCE